MDDSIMKYEGSLRYRVQYHSQICVSLIHSRFFYIFCIIPGYIQSVFAAFLVQNFTQLGFGLVRAPQDLTDALQEGIRGGLERGEARLEHTVNVMEGPRCLFIDRPDLTQRVSQIRWARRSPRTQKAYLLTYICFRCC
jgi:hypothetical protein